jgi:hypothetical protein
VTVLLVDPYSGVVHLPSCVHAAASIPWEGFARASSDRPCKVCAPEVPEPESEDA